MEHWIELVRSSASVLIGFLLAQLINIAKLIMVWIKRPRLVIEHENGNYLLYCGDENVGESGEYLEERIYGFRLRNIGRTIAKNVTVQITRVDVKVGDSTEFRTVIEGSGDLGEYRSPSSMSKEGRFTLVPNGSVLIRMAGSREDYGNTIFPQKLNHPEFYEEITYGSSKYRFWIAAFDEYDNFTSAIVEIP